MRAAGVAYRRGLRRGDGAAALSLALALSTGACGVSVPIASLVPDDTTTGSIAAKPVSPLSPDLNPEDWRRARGALAVALDPQGSGASVTWENPDTGRKGSFVPAGQPFVKADSICRAFRATLTGPESVSSLQGTACRLSWPDWAIKDVKPQRKPA
jgi:surface antigen